MSKSLFFKLTISIVFFSLIGIKAYAGTIFSNLFSLVIIAIIFSFFFIKVELNLKAKSAIIYYLLYVILVYVSFVRQYLVTDLSHLGLINISLIFAAIIIIPFIALQNVNFNNESFLRFIQKIIFSYILLNLISALFGIRRNNLFIDSNLGTNEFFQNFGLEIERVLFFFAPNLSYFAMICGIFLILSFVLGHPLKRPTSFFLNIIIGIIALLLTDARGPLFGLLIILILYLFKKIWYRFHILIFIGFTFAILFYSSIMFFVQNNFDVKEIARENSTLLSNREIIWDQFFSNYDPGVYNLAFGYGNVGQFISGLSNYYKHLFSNWENSEQISLHNNTLQLLVDVGLFGILFLVITIIKTNNIHINNYKLERKNIHLLIPLIITYLFLLGSTDIVTNIANVGTFFIINLLLQFTLLKHLKSHL